MLSDRVVALLLLQPGLLLSYIRYRLPDVPKSELDKCLTDLSRDGVVEKRGHARYWLTGKHRKPRTPVLDTAARTGVARISRASLPLHVHFSTIAGAADGEKVTF